MLRLVTPRRLRSEYPYKLVSDSYRNRCSKCPGIVARFRPESLLDYPWNTCSIWTGVRKQDDGLARAAFLKIDFAVSHWSGWRVKSPFNFAIGDIGTRLKTRPPDHALRFPAAISFAVALSISMNRRAAGER